MHRLFGFKRGKISMKIAYLVVVILFLIGLAVLPPGCKEAVVKSEPTPIAPANPAQPLLDRLPHSSVETAYFALG
jgi:hypothetical protein